jgi:hypothetical protein
MPDDLKLAIRQAGLTLIPDLCLSVLLDGNSCGPCCAATCMEGCSVGCSQGCSKTTATGCSLLAIISL